MSDANVNVDSNDIINSLSQQIGALSRDIAVLNAVVEAQKNEILRLREAQQKNPE